MHQIKLSSRGKFFISITSICLIIILIDQFNKYKIRSNGGFYICNNGMSFGFHLPNIPFWIILILFMAIISTYLFSNKKNNFSSWLILGYGLFFGGTISNLADRFFYGCVIDHISTSWNFLPVFNTSDITIFLGACLLLVANYKNNKPMSE